MMIQGPQFPWASGMAVLAIITTKRKGMLERISIAFVRSSRRLPRPMKANRDAEGMTKGI